MTIGELMSGEPYTVGEDETVLVAWELLERTGVHHLPVVRADGRCAGLLDRADLAVACATPAAALSSRRVGALLRGRPATVHRGDTVRRAAAVMDGTGADALPVVDERGVLVGLVTARDLVAALAGRERERGPAAARPPRPFPVIPGLPPRRPG